mgnify:CR=1 FL=1
MRFTIKYAAVASLVALAAGVLPASAEADPVKLVTGNDYKPFTDESLPEGGLSTATVRAVYAHLGEDVSVTFAPWKRGYRAVLEGAYAATFPYVKTSKRQEDYRFSDPIFTTRNKPLVLAESDIAADSVEDLKGMAYCQPNAYAPPEILKKMQAQGTLERNAPANMSLCMRMLKRGRIDFIPVNNVQGPATARDVFGSTDPVRFLDITLTKTHNYVIFPRNAEDTAEAVARFNKGLAAIRDNGIYESIVERFLGDDGGV